MGYVSIHHNHELVKSVDGVGLITAVEPLVKNREFHRTTTARQYSALLNCATRKIIGKMDKEHISKIGNRRTRPFVVHLRRKPRLHKSRRLNCITRDAI